MPTQQILYFVGEGVFAPVLDSQVIIPLKIIREKFSDAKLSLLILTSFRHFNKGSAKKREHEIRKELPGIEVFNFSRPPLGVPFQGHVWAGKLKKCICKLNLKKNEKILIHCRGHTTAAAAAILKKTYSGIRTFMDIRGDCFDELNSVGLKGRYLQRHSMNLFTIASKSASGLNTVSSRLQNHIMNQQDINPEIVKTIIGCCVDIDRFFFDSNIRQEYRRKLNLSGKFVLCYCGAMSHWQKPDIIAEVFHIVKQKISNAHMLIISKEPAPLIENLKKLGYDQESFTSLSAPHSEVANYLMAGDIALLLRENNMTNNVASPVKFAEYLRCGLPVILTPYIGDFSKIVEENKVGSALNLPLSNGEVINSVEKIKEKLELEGFSYREHCSKVASDELSWKGKISELIKAYDIILKD